MEYNATSTAILISCALYSPSVQEPGAQDHNGLTGALLELHLDGAELAVNDAHHTFDLFWRDGSRP